MSYSLISKSILSLTVAALLVGGVSAEAQPKRSRPGNPGALQVAPAPTVAETPRVEAPSRETEIRRGFHFSAFIEPEMRFTNKDWISDRGFTLNDAALYITKSFGTAEAVVDLPFANEAGGPVAFDAVRAQAYIHLDKQPMFVKFGQFDTPFGVERNDSRDRFFVDSGVLKSFMIPHTHLGLQAGATFQGGMFTVLGQVTDHYDTQVLTPAPQGGGAKADDPEFAVQGRFNKDNVHAGIGFLVNENKNSADPKTNLLVDINGGVLADKVSIDGEVVIRKFAGLDKTSFGLMGLGAFQVSNDLALGGRFEYAKDFLGMGGAAIETMFELSAGPSYKLDDGLLLRGDFSLANYKQAAPGSTDQTIFGVSAGLVAAF